MADKKEFKNDFSWSFSRIMHLIHAKGNIIIPIMEAGVVGTKMLMS